MKFEDMLGKTLVSITGAEQYSEHIEFTDTEGCTYIMEHSQDCCESVSVEEIVGPIQALIGSPILLAEEVSSPAEGTENTEYSDDEQTWTFYKLGTLEDTVTFRWYGTSNGYYSTVPCFYKKGERW